MAELRDLSVNQETANEREAAARELFPNELLLDVVQNLELGENMLDEIGNRRMQDEDNLLVLSLQLTEATIRLLKMQLKLFDLKHKKFKERLKSCLNGLNNIMSNFQNLPYRKENNYEHNQFQKKLDSLTTAKEELKDLSEDFPNCGDDEETFLDEIYGEFLDYLEPYRECVLHIENFLQKAESNFKISNLPRESQEELCVLFSVLEENLASYNTILLSSKEEFENFELILKNDFEMFSQDYKKIDSCRIDFFIDAIKKAELAYKKLETLLFEIVNFDCVIPRNN